MRVCLCRVAVIDYKHDLHLFYGFFDDAFAIHDIKVIESQNGLFIAMPSRKTPNGEFKDIAHPINAETREKIQGAILEAYEAPETESAE